MHILNHSIYYLLTKSNNMKNKIMSSLLLFIVCIHPYIHAEDGPTMGWSSWNTYRVNISDSLIMRQADAMVEKDMKKVGYKYINIDDGYFGGRAEDGTLLIHPIRFPNGLKGVVNHIHNLGLKAGIYSDAGRNTCGNFYDKDSIAQGVGLYGHDQRDADFFFRDMGFDFIKVDFCGGSAHQNTEHLSLDEQKRYTAISNAIKNTGRTDVRMNICRWNYPGTWAENVAFSWRISQDIRPRWSSVKNIIGQNLYLSAYCRNGHYNDMDMLEVGRGMTAEEDRTHFGMWCIMSSPLLIGCDLTKIKPNTQQLLTNTELIALNQDPLHLQAYVADVCNDCYILVKDIKKLHSNVRAIAVYNPSDSPKTVTIDFNHLELDGKVSLRDLFERKNIGTFNGSYTLTIPAHATRIYRAKGDRRIERRRYEAETAYIGAYQELKNNEVYSTGIYENDKECSGGMKATCLGGNRENYIEWDNVYSKKGGEYILTIAYKTNAFAKAVLSVNGSIVRTIKVQPSNGIRTITTIINLKASENTITLYNAHDRMPDIDYIDVCESRELCIRNLTVEGRKGCTMGLDEKTPRLGWQLQSYKPGTMQEKYSIQIATDKDMLQKGIADVWDSGVRTSSQSQWVNIDAELKPNTSYFWQVTVTDNFGRVAKSDIGQWSTGLFDDTHWEGEWIGIDSLFEGENQTRHSRIAARYLHKNFNLGKVVKRATAHICGLGYYLLDINNHRIGNSVLTPAPTDYDKTVAYDSYDVTEILKKGTNSIDVTLGPGYYFAMAQNYQTNVRTTYGFPKLRMNLIVEYTDGTSVTIVTDETWRLSVNGPIRYANIYDGTLIDYRRSLRTDSSWMAARIVAAPKGKLRGGMLGGVITYARDTANIVTGTKTIIDFGTNSAGRISLNSITIPEGDTVRIRYAEQLKKNGKELYTDNLRASENTDYFIGNGNSVDLKTEFIWHGFRYAEVSGLSENDAKRIVRENMTDDLISEADIDISEKGNADKGMLNRIMENARRGILDNYKGIPMDCPQRDERMPWLGDRTMGCFGESYITHNHTMYVKWLKDICDSQRANGSISDVSPAYWRLYNGNITWPAALPFGLEMLLIQYGDERPWQRMKENVERFLDFAKKKSLKEGLITYDRYGDWCVPPASLNEVHTKDEKRLTDGVLLSSCYYYYICKMLKRDEEAANMREAINRRFLNNGQYANGTVTANLLPLAMDIVPEDCREAVKNNLIKKIKGENNDPHIDCGVIGIQWLLRYLTREGYGELAYRIASTATYPSWGYMIEQGATTIWELWNGNTADPSMNSGNHVMLLGDFIPWMFECLAGIAPDPENPGFKHIVMKPDFGIREIDGVKACYPSLYGNICSKWTRDANGNIYWEIEIPANTSATAFLPDGKTKELSSGRHLIEVED